MKGPHVLEKLYERLLRARLLEEDLADAFGKGKIDGWLHSGLGQELAGSIYGAALGDDDYLVPYHRSRAALLARGVSIQELVSEIFLRVGGVVGGRGGETHIVDPKRGIVGATGIIGGQIPFGIGCGFAAQVRGEGAISLVGFGDGAVAQGSFHECLNLAALWSLPTLFVCENNFYAEMTPIEKSLSQTEISRFAESYGMPVFQLDGYDVDDCLGGFDDAFALAREGSPVLVEVRTYRWSGHFEGDPESYRDKEEVAEWRERDPLEALEKRLVGTGVLEEDGVEKMKAEIREQIAECLDTAGREEAPSASSLLNHVYADK